MSLGRLNQSSPSPASRLVSRMTTLHEEKPATSPTEISISPPLESDDQMKTKVNKYCVLIF